MRVLPRGHLRAHGRGVEAETHWKHVEAEEIAHWKLQKAEQEVHARFVRGREKVY